MLFYFIAPFRNKKKKKGITNKHESNMHKKETEEIEQKLYFGIH